MPKVSTKSLRRLASKLPESAGVVSGALTESADYINELEKALEFYANKQDYMDLADVHITQMTFTELGIDKGERARIALGRS